MGMCVHFFICGFHPDQLEREEPDQADHTIHVCENAVPFVYASLCCCVCMSVCVCIYWEPMFSLIAS